MKFSNDEVREIYLMAQTYEHLAAIALYRHRAGVEPLSPDKIAYEERRQRRCKAIYEKCADYMGRTVWKWQRTAYAMVEARA